MVMPVIYICPICREKFFSKEKAREHVKTKHKEYVDRIVSQLSESRIKGLKKRNIDPENWAAGYILMTGVVAT